MADAVDYLKTNVPALEELLVAHQRQVLEQSRRLEVALNELRIREEELQRSNAELEEFAYVASHDLKAPLRAIRNLADWVIEDAGALLPEASLGHLRAILQRARGMEALVDHLLEYSRAGRVRGDIEEVELSRLVEQIVALLQAPPEFSVSVDSEIGVLTTHRVLLEQVLRNLIGNALEHHDRPAGRVDVSARDLGAEIEFTVSDDGPGIPLASRERVFEMFQTCRERDGVDGSGMGLAIVKKIVTGQGGSIRVEEGEGGGATFRFTWPRSSGDEGAQAPAGEPGEDG